MFLVKSLRAMHFPRSKEISITAASHHFGIVVRDGRTQSGDSGHITLVRTDGYNTDPLHFLGLPHY